jgi:type VI secretion system secreted protein Hcp
MSAAGCRPAMFERSVSMTATPVSHRARLVALILAAFMLAAAGLAIAASRPGASNASAATAGVVHIEMKITGHKIGVFKGDSSQKGHEDQILVSGYSFEVDSPRDAASGQASGKRQYKPIMITKELNGSSPQLLQAAATNEILTSVVINFYKSDRTGKQSNYYRVTLTDGSISSVHQYSSGATVNEDVSFTFRKIEQEDLVAKTSFEDDWELAIT